VVEYREKMYTCQKLCVRAQKRRYFSAWTEFVSLQVYQRRQHAIAQIYHRRFLLVCCIYLTIAL